MHQRITLSDIADQAGVSTATVSRVLNGKSVVAEVTRRQVLVALDLLGYERPEMLRQVSKFCQENLVTSWCGSFGVTPVLFRLQNVYGPGQSLINPYTGIVSLFARLARAGESIPVYEDGQIVRDFVFIDDVASAIVAGVLHSPATVQPYDIGLRKQTTIMQVAQVIAEHYGAPAPHVTGQFRDGDVRAAWADTARARQALDWEPRVGVAEGINRLCDWIDAQADASADTSPAGTSTAVSTDTVTEV